MNLTSSAIIDRRYSKKYPAKVNRIVAS